MKLTKTRAAAFLFAALLYAVSPWDGDFIPVVGWIDDMLIMALALWTMWNSWQPPRKSEAPRPEAPAAESSWEVLGLRSGAPEGEIRRAYREQMALYHPDKVAHLGAELRKKAEERTLLIQRAYRDLLGEEA